MQSSHSSNIQENMMDGVGFGCSLSFVWRQDKKNSTALHNCFLQGGSAALYRSPQRRQVVMLTPQPPPSLGGAGLVRTTVAVEEDADPAPPSPTVENALHGVSEVQERRGGGRTDAYFSQPYPLVQGGRPTQETMVLPLPEDDEDEDADVSLFFKNDICQKVKKEKSQ